MTDRFQREPSGRVWDPTVPQVDYAVHGDAVVVRVAGEIDMSTASHFREAMDKALDMATPPGPMLVDLTAVEFFGSSGLAELVVTQQEAAARQLTLRIVADCRAVLRPMEVSGLDEIFDIYPDVDSAIR